MPRSRHSSACARHCSTSSSVLREVRWRVGGSGAEDQACAMTLVVFCRVNRVLFVYVPPESVSLRLRRVIGTPWRCSRLLRRRRPNSSPQHVLTECSGCLRPEAFDAGAAGGWFVGCRASCNSARKRQDSPSQPIFCRRGVGSWLGLVNTWTPGTF